jgi:DNA repair protein RecN (Recombination protein N)
MLQLLRIRNFALIRELEIEFGAGLNLLTGETGSGKSILMDALGLLLGSRSSVDYVRSGCDAAVIEGIFDLRGRRKVRSLLREAGFDTPGEQRLRIRREISASGRNRIHVNQGLATLGFLKTMGGALADICGQQEQRSLLDLATHLAWLDDFGGNAELRREAGALYRRLRDAARELEKVETGEEERARRIDILRFQVEEIRRVDPRPGEREELENERALLSNRERILERAAGIYRLLYEGDSPLLGGLAQLGRLLGELEELDPAWAAHRAPVEESRYRLEDLAYAARDYGSRSDFSAERLEEVHQRLQALDALARKYGASCEEILASGRRCAGELEALESASGSAGRLREELARALDAYAALARTLSEKRRRDAAALERRIRAEFGALAMDRMRLEVRFHPAGEGEGARGIPAGYGPRGMDRVEFWIAPNEGEEMRPLETIASGGELSRIMLAVQSLCGGSRAGGTLVFDEVDAGIGGRVAEAVGRRLRDLARSNQVLCVTHLPHIAAFAHRHYRVCKESAGGRTETAVLPLDEGARVEELSRMLGGETITEKTRHYALEMLERSRPPQKESTAKAP